MRTLIYLTLILVLPSLGFSRTWIVEKDGSGDYTVIQDAVDAAESGDVIEIGSGRYEEFQVMHFIYTNDVFIYPGDKSLTFRGAGVGETIVGPSDPNMTTHYAWGITSDVIGEDYIKVSGITFDNLNYRGIGVGFNYLEVIDCSFTDSSMANNWTIGISSSYSSASLIRNCYFENLPRDCISIFGPTTGMVIEDCQVVNCNYGMGFWDADTSDIVVRNCNLSAPQLPIGHAGSGFYVSSGASIEIDNCYVEYFDDAILVSDAHVVVHDSVLRFSDRGEISVTDDFSLNAYNNIMETEVGVLNVNGPGTNFISLNNNHFLRYGDGLYIKCNPEHWIWGEESLQVDMTNNYWGTQDVDEIAEYIIDGNDPPYIVNFFVVFLPLADGPVATEAITLDGVKALYR
jgi:hypothetical protein|nr:right-handed parallel beta-helix repeat-containing protein [Candidatus Krumholzibacteria bacterium]